MSMNDTQVKTILEAAILSADFPISFNKLKDVFYEEDEVTPEMIQASLQVLMSDYDGRGVELVEVASGYRFQARQDTMLWLTRMRTEKPARYSRALIETMALIAYRQPITRAEIEEVRGVAVSTQIIKTLLEREWVRVIGHRDVPGRPSLYASTKQFLDDLNLKSLSDLPTLAEIKDADEMTEKQLQLAIEGASDNEAESVSSTISADALDDEENGDETGYMPVAMSQVSEAALAETAAPTHLSDAEATLAADIEILDSGAPVAQADASQAEDLEPGSSGQSSADDTGLTVESFEATALGNDSLQQPTASVAALFEDSSFEGHDDAAAADEDDRGSLMRAVNAAFDEADEAFDLARPLPKDESTRTISEMFTTESTTDEQSSGDNPTDSESTTNDIEAEEIV